MYFVCNLDFFKRKYFNQQIIALLFIMNWRQYAGVNNISQTFKIVYMWTKLEPVGTTFLNDFRIQINICSCLVLMIFTSITVTVFHTQFSLHISWKLSTRFKQVFMQPILLRIAFLWNGVSGPYGQKIQYGKDIQVELLESWDLFEWHSMLQGCGSKPVPKSQTGSERSPGTTHLQR